MKPFPKYQPHNYSTTRCHVVSFSFTKAGRFGFDVKLPYYIGKIKGIYVTANANIPFALFGRVYLNFNEGQLKTFQLYLVNSKMLRDAGLPYPVDEEIKPNSVLQGYYHIRSEGLGFNPAGTVRIYLHYTPRD